VTIRIQCIYDSKDESSEGSATSEDKRPKSLKNRRNRDETDKDPASNSDSISTSSSYSISSDSEPQQKKKDKYKKTVRRGSTTAKQEKKARESRSIAQIYGDYGHRLIKRWYCTSHIYPNRTHYYWQPIEPPELTGRHFKLFGPYIT